ncbi:hypothetical protein ABK040_015070 [Willaertia magna]
MNQKVLKSKPYIITYSDIHTHRVKINKTKSLLSNSSTSNIDTSTTIISSNDDNNKINQLIISNKLLPKNIKNNNLQNNNNCNVNNILITIVIDQNISKKTLQLLKEQEKYLNNNFEYLIFFKNIKNNKKLNSILNDKKWNDLKNKIFIEYKYSLFKTLQKILEKSKGKYIYYFLNQFNIENSKNNNYFIEKEIYKIKNNFKNIIIEMECKYTNLEMYSFTQLFNTSNYYLSIYSNHYGISYSKNSNNNNLIYLYNYGRMYNDKINFNEFIFCNTLFGSFIKRNSLNIAINSLLNEPNSLQNINLENNNLENLENFKDNFNEIDFCISLQNKNFKIKSSNEITYLVTIKNNKNNKNEINEYSFLNNNDYNNNNPYLDLNTINYNLKIKNNNLISKYKYLSSITINSSILYDFGAGSCSGWFIETTNIVTNLEINYNLKNFKIITGRDDFCEGLELFKKQSLERLLNYNNYNNNYNIDKI